MEDSAKALLIAAGVLIAIMIITFGLALYSSLTQYIDDTQNRIDENELQRFNEQFTKYINCEDERGGAIIYANNTRHSNSG